MLVLLQLVAVADVPPNVTVLVPWLVPKLVPLMVTEVPTGPVGGDRLAIPGVTAKLMLLLGRPPTVTTTDALPSPRLSGTETTRLVLLQLAIGVEAPPMVTVLAPWLAPKLVPVMVTWAPTGPESGATAVIPGVTLKLNVLLEDPSTVTTTGALPKPRLGGTITTILVSLQLVAVAATPPMVIVLVPCDGLKLVPAMVTKLPTGAWAGEMLLIAGGGLMVIPTAVV
jgi:hypothetical protein